MIRFGAVLTVVVVAMGLLAGGVLTNSLLLVYLAIGVAALSAVMLAVGLVIWRGDIFGEASAQQAAASAGLSAGTAGMPGTAGTPGTAPAPVGRVPVGQTAAFVTLGPSTLPDAPPPPSPPWRPEDLHEPGRLPEPVRPPEPEDLHQPERLREPVRPPEPEDLPEPARPPEPEDLHQERRQRPERPAEQPAPKQPEAQVAPRAEAAPEAEAAPQAEAAPDAEVAPDAEAEPHAEAEPAGAGGAAGGGKDAPSPGAEVTIVPGIARYHRGDCILIRFLGPEDLESMSRQAAEDAGCVPCKACRPEQELSGG